MAFVSNPVAEATQRAHASVGLTPNPVQLRGDSGGANAETPGSGGKMISLIDLHVNSAGQVSPADMADAQVSVPVGRCKLSLKLRAEFLYLSHVSCSCTSAGCEREPLRSVASNFSPRPAVCLSGEDQPAARGRRSGGQGLESGSDALCSTLAFPCTASSTAAARLTRRWVRAGPPTKCAQRAQAAGRPQKWRRPPCLIGW